MLADNCAAHAVDVQLTNVKLAFLPPNTTSLAQPMDQGIIANFKKQYRSLVLQRLVNDMDTGMSSGDRAAEVARKLTALDSLHMQREAWNKISQSTIVNCYSRASFVLAMEDNAADKDEEQGGEGGENSDSQVYVLPGMAMDDFERYAAMNDNLSTEADISESDIIGTVQQSEDQPSDNNEDDDNVTTEPVSLSVAKWSRTFANFLNRKARSLMRPYKLEAAVYGLHRDFFKRN